MNETKRDYDFAVDVLDETVLCPSCGAQYENSFADRFGIAQDEERCFELTAELQSELIDIIRKIDVVSVGFSKNNKVLSDIEKKLEARKNEIKLKDLIESEGRREMSSLFQDEIAGYDEKLAIQLLARRKSEATLKILEDKVRTKSIKERFYAYMSSFLIKLDVLSMKPASYKNISGNIQESGSAMPRALMAYYYSILHVIQEFGSSAYCPIIIDAPNQQGQDRKNLPILLKFIADQQPRNSQLILAIEELHDTKFEGTVIELNRKRKVLEPEQFNVVYNSLSPYLAKSLNYDG